MNTFIRSRFVWIAAVVLAAIMLIGAAAAPAMSSPSTSSSDDRATATRFADAVDLSPLDGIAIYHRGRVLSFPSFASSYGRFLTGNRELDGQTPVFTILDLAFRPERYRSMRSLYVKKKLIRSKIAKTMVAEAESQVASLRAAGDQSLTPEQLESTLSDMKAMAAEFMDDGMITPQLFEEPAIRSLLDTMSLDILRGAKPVQAIKGGLSLLEPGRVAREMTIIPPTTGEPEDRWHTLDEVGAGQVNGMSQDDMQALSGAWTQLGRAWRSENAAAVSEAVATIASRVPTLASNAELYPDARRLELESWYFRARNMTWAWIPFAFTLIPLTLFVVFRWPNAYRIGFVMFFAAFALQTAALVLRWHISGRWPNSNMFEAVTTAAWFGGAFALLFEVFGRKLPLRGLMALGSSVASMAALMAAYLYPLSLDPHISNRMPVLLDIWLYIHTNVIIFSYCLIFMGSVSATGYLIYRTYLLMAGKSKNSAAIEAAKVGGAASIIMTGPSGESIISRGRTTPGQILDGTTMILMELGAIMLWAGLIMGAIWADHSWGRPWGWDPKEVFALNSFLIFAILIHVRLKAKDKGLWTAIIAIIGCVVMLFNWIIINFTIAGLHSYA